MLHLELHLTLPSWVQSLVNDTDTFVSNESRMALAVQLSQLNISHQTGGPFGAAVFTEQGQLLGVGVNRVVHHCCSAAHAEMLALTTAQKRLKKFRLNDNGERIILATSAQPCSMCYGALIWAGIDELLIAARADDVQTLTGFDEGPLPSDWQGELEKRGITIRTDILRDEACAVLKAYGASGVVY
jgi:tRNA(Arg) A34 adenosine deaminase TadA